MEQKQQETERQRAEEERQRQQQAEARRQMAKERQQREAAKKQRVEELRVPPSGGGAADTPQRFVADAPPTKVGTQNDSARRWPKWAAGGAAAVLGVSLLGYSLSGYFTKSVSPSSETTTVAKQTAAPATLPGNVKMEFMLIPSGSFTMGSPANEEDRSADEGPQHEVTISKPFNLGKYEVTQAQWAAVMGNNPSRFKECNKCPVEQVSWEDVQQFIGKLNGLKDGYTYRLPTEAEWEYTARAGSTGEYAGVLDNVAWYEKNSAVKHTQ